MKGIFINTTLSEIEVALVQNKELVRLRKWDQSRNESSKLQPSIIELLNEVDWSTDDVERIFLITGPGSFTAIRVGVIVAKAIAEKLGIDIGIMNTFEYLEHSLSELDDCPILLNAGGNSVYRFGKGIDMEIVDLDDHMDFFDKSIKFLSPKQLKKYELSNDKIENLEKRWPKICGEFRIIKGGDIADLEPNYVKSPNIT